MRQKTAPKDQHPPGGDLNTVPARQAPKAHAKPKAEKFPKPEENLKDHPPEEETGTTPEPPAPRTPEINNSQKTTKGREISPQSSSRGPSRSRYDRRASLSWNRTSRRNRTPSPAGACWYDTSRRTSPSPWRHSHQRYYWRNDWSPPPPSANQKQ